DAMRRLLKAGGADLDALVAKARSRSFKPVPLNLRTSIKFENDVSRVRTANVAGLLPGSDPKLRDEVVIYSAHHDHFGIGEPDKSGDRIYNGAEDNAAGCAQLLAIARTFAALPERPRRSVLFLFVAGEEQGLLGSKYYSLHPTFPAGKIAANINYDGGNFLGRTRDLTQVGAGKSSLDAIARALVEKQGRVLVPDLDRGEHQLRRRQLPRPYPRPHAGGRGQIVAGRDRPRAGGKARSRAGARPESGQGLLLPFRPVLVREDRRAGAVLRRGHRLHRQARGLGQA